LTEDQTDLLENHVAVWLSGLNQQSYCMPGPVTTGTGDRSGVQLPVQETYLNV